MCLMRPRREPPIEFVDRRPIRKVYVARTPSPRRSATRTRISETVIVNEPPPAQYVQAPAPRASVPKIVKEPTPPPPPAPAPPARVELVEVEEGISPKVSRSSVAGSRRSRSVRDSKSEYRHEKKSSRGGEEREVYIERERERIRGLGAPPPSPHRLPIEEPPDTYRYVEGTAPRRERSRSITYESNPRTSGRLIERERVVVEDGGRRREFYQRR